MSLNTVLPPRFSFALRKYDLLPTRFVLTVSVARQNMRLFQGSVPHGRRRADTYQMRDQYRISTSVYGAGQTAHSNKTPLGLHRVASKIGAGQPIGTVFRNRQPKGLSWQGMPEAPIAHRILWLEGLEPGYNRGGKVDTFRRYIYIHGYGDETTLGRPVSLGCIHLAAKDLMPLFDLLPVGTLVWIAP
jgi:hypothetical protein